MPTTARIATTWVAIAALLAGAAMPAAAAPPLSRADYEACQAKDEAGFRSAIEAITHKALQGGLARVDFAAIVADEWRSGGLDETLDKRVDLAIAEVRSESSWGTLLSSLAYKEEAQKLATSVAERVYRAEAVKTAIETLAGGVGRQVGRTIELATSDAAEPAMQCMQAFLGPRYGATVSRAVARDAAREFALDPTRSGAQLSTGAVLAEGKEGIAGAVVLVVRRQLAGMAGRVGQRIVGAVLSRLVSVVAGGVGLVLIAKDIWDFRHGVLPIIASEMKSKETKDKVRDELARAIAEQIGEHTREIAAASAERIVEIWRDFRRAHLKVLEIAERDASFRGFLDTVKPERLARTDEIVALILASEGEAGVLKRLGDGTLATAIEALPDAALEIARETRSLETALGWHALADSAVGKILEIGIHKRSKPQEFTRATLARLLRLDDRLAVVRIASVPRTARDVLLELDDAELRSLARGLGEDELETLSRYMTGLSRPASQRVLKAVAASPARMQVLAAARVRDGLLASRDQGAAVDMMLRDAGGPDPRVVLDDFRMAWDGRVSPLLMWDRHPAAVVAIGLAGLVLLLMLRRLLFGGRRRAPAAAGG